MDWNQNLHQINLKKNTIETSETAYSGLFGHSSFVIQDKFHFFKDDKHLIWNDKKKEFEEQQNTPNDLTFYSSIIAYIPSKKSLFKIGGWT